ncbi:GntR family transcriptional regulator [Streptomyces viridochromogenes]|uniref:GntR family transcriptional regulator n=1 Tax=Streptomyces viridochromogenes TaxID=1938 RepID=A0A0J7Z1K4_STRVR|nr:GntR family transcriptional regulator [Streptomyces viridochromogenes]KMS69492.1 GntR family transcriptional regulator [Streptomyces viridochromogenes]
MVVTQEDVAVNGSRGPSSQEIADTLRERIRTGELRAGDRLPTQAELAEEFGVERGAVRQALRALQQDGLLSNVSKGSPPRIAESAPTWEEPQPTMVALAPRLAEAFAAPRVRIDAACLTAETLMLALSEPLRLIHEGRLHPESIEARILLPSRDINLAFPISVEGHGDDDPVHQDWLARRNAQGQVLRHNLQALRYSHGIDVQVAFRALPFTPPVKLYLLNGVEALISYYMIGRREGSLESGSGPTDVYDVLGTESLLFSFEKAAGRRDVAFVTESQKWFDALWETITTDLKLS